MRILVSSILTTVLAVGVSGPVTAKEARTAELVCDDGHTYTVEGQLNGNAFHEVDTSLEYIVQNAYRIVDGDPVLIGKNLKSGPGFVTCDYTSASGTQYVFDGIFAPRR